MKKITMRNRGYIQSRRITKNISDMGGDFVVRTFVPKERDSVSSDRDGTHTSLLLESLYIYTSLFKNSIYMDKIKLHMLISSFLSEPSHISIWFTMLYTLVLLVSGAGHR